MANAVHVGKLEEGPRAWNAWRAENPGIAPDLSRLGLSVGRRQFGPAQGGPVDLSRADLSDADLEQATLIEANLAGASLVDADLSHARMENADLQGADLSNAGLEQTDLKNARLGGATLSGAQLRYARNLTQAQIDQAIGNDRTSLPPGLAMPEAWSRNAGAAFSRLARRASDKSSIPKGDPHSVLGVSRRASTREIRAAYLRLAKELHPDGRIEDPIAAERLKVINDAYQELKGFGGGAAARKAERKSFARRARVVFLVGFLTSSAPLLLALSAYHSGFFGPQDEKSNQAAKPESIATDAISTISKRPAGTAEGLEIAWSEAESAGTREAWQHFIEAYPDGNHAAKARQAVAAIDAAEARQRADRTAWAAAEKSGARDALQLYLDVYPDGNHAAKARQALAAIDATEARQRADLAAWAAAEKSGARDGLQRYLDVYPDGDHAAKVRQALAAIDAAEARQRADLAAWAAAEKNGNRDGLQRYLDVHPDGDHVAKARQALAAIDAAEARQRADLAAWAAAEKSGGKAALRSYLSKYPSGGFAAEAQQRLALLEAEETGRAQDDAAWSNAERRNSRASYAAYLRAHPNGHRAGDARARIADLERVEAKAVASAVLKEPTPAPKAARQTGPAPAAVQKWPSADEPFVGADGRIRR